MDSYQFTNFQGQGVKFASLSQNCFVGSNSKSDLSSIKPVLADEKKKRRNIEIIKRKVESKVNLGEKQEAK